MYEKHGETKHPLYVNWRAMRHRCNGNSDKARWYRDRGIRVCDEWASFIAFKAWAEANGYRPGLTIDRIDPSGNYEPSNCRWTDPRGQGEHRANSCMVEIDGVSLTVRQWSARTGIMFTTLYKRYHKGVRGKEFIAPPRTPSWQKIAPR